MGLFNFLGGIASGFAGAIGQKRAQERQYSHNLKLAKYQNTWNEAQLEKQLAYNTPANQMQRYKDAGLNPHLIYGQGNPGNQSAPLTSADIKPTEQRNIMGEAFARGLATFQETRMMQSQINAIDAGTVKTQLQGSLANLQAQVLAKNPLLNETGFAAIIDSLKSTAELKSQQAQLGEHQRSALMTRWVGKRPSPDTDGSSIAERKIYAELDLLEQRFKLGEADNKIKAQVWQSKEFQNAILEIQKRFMTDFELTPQHVVQFIQMLLIKSIPNN